MENQVKNELEHLLTNEQETINNIRIRQEVLRGKGVVPPLKANKSATLFDFIKMVGKVISTGTDEEKIEFVFDEGKRLTNDPSEKIEHPFITYKIISRQPMLELKPRERESTINESVDKSKDGRQGRIYGQKFKCLVQFNIIASEYTAADRVMNIFEDLIFSYTHFFKKNGVSEILFENHLTDKDYDIYRQDLSVRNLVYYVEIEKLYVMFDSDIEDISIK